MLPIVWIYVVVTQIIFMVLQERTNRELAEITDSLWRQEMREKYPSPPFPPQP